MIIKPDTHVVHEERKMYLISQDQGNMCIGYHEGNTDYTRVIKLCVHVCHGHGVGTKYIWKLTICVSNYTF